MSISTKTGDKGQTSLWSGERVSKNDLRVEAYGTIDELNSHLGEAKHLVKSDRIKQMIIEIQRDLFKVGGTLASTGAYVNPVLDSDVERITQYVYDFEKEIKLTGFVLPGNTLASAKLDICRTIARRSERRILTLNDKLTLHGKDSVPEAVIQYVNRLSDLLYMMARAEDEHLDKV